MREADRLPAGIAALGGGLAAGESLERLTIAPPDGASPLNMTISEVVDPPVMGLDTLIRCRAGGCTVKETDADDALSVPVSVTSVAAVTSPTWKRNWPKETPAGTVKVTGAGAAVESLLVRFTVAPPEGAGAVSCTVTVSVSPLDAGSMETASDPIFGGVAGTTKEPVADQAVFAGTPGAESPWVESTCQYLVPAVREVTVQCGPVIWLLTYSIVLKEESSAISRV